MKLIKLQLMCWFLPTNMLLKKVNHPNFTNREIGIIGSALIRRFKTQEDLERRCEQLFAENF